LCFVFSFALCFVCTLSYFFNEWQSSCHNLGLHNLKKKWLEYATCVFFSSVRDMNSATTHVRCLHVNQVLEVQNTVLRVKHGFIILETSTHYLLQQVKVVLCIHELQAALQCSISQGE
jgi:hypothetical protein